MKIDFEKVALTIENSSPEIKDLMFSTEVSDKLEEIAEANRLSEDQYLDMVDEVGYAILGLKQRFVFSQSLLDIGIEKAKSEVISREIESKIFSKLDKNATETEKEAKPNINSKELSLKVDEIAKKYNLNENQKNELTNISSQAIQNNESKDIVSGNIVSRLGTSQLLAEQISVDLENRIFNSVSKITKPQPTPEQKPVSRVPEIKPDNLPAVEIGENAKPYVPEYKKIPVIEAISPVPPDPKGTLGQSYPGQDLGRKEEQVQKPYGVPRFGVNSIPPKVQVINMNQTKPASPQGMMDDKMKSVTVNMGENFVEKHTDAPAIPPTKYGSDPYREPIN